MIKFKKVSSGNYEAKTELSFSSNGKSAGRGHFTVKIESHIPDWTNKAVWFGMVEGGNESKNVREDAGITFDTMREAKEFYAGLMKDGVDFSC